MRTTLIKVHQQLVRDCKYNTARKLLQFLNRKRITLSFSDADFKLESILETLGFRAQINKRNWLSSFFL